LTACGRNREKELHALRPETLAAASAGFEPSARLRGFLSLNKYFQLDIAILLHFSQHSSHLMSGLVTREQFALIRMPALDKQDACR
jgi:hypothetical protein